MMVCKSGELEDIQILLNELKTKDTEINIQDANQKTGLHHAVENNYDSVVDLLLKNKADVNIPDANGNSVLHIAAMKGSIGMTKILLEHGASKDLKNNAEKTPGDIAKENTCPKGHKLDHIEDPNGWRCNSGFQSCKKFPAFEIYGPHYRCLECNFDNCLDCYKLKENNQTEITKLLNDTVAIKN